MKKAVLIQSDAFGQPIGDPEGQPFGREAFVFGDEIGRRRKSAREAWERARIAAGIADFHLADLRHEAASRWEEAGVGTHVVSKMLGHSNLKTTTIYINANERQLHNAARRIDEIREAAALARSLQDRDRNDDRSTESIPQTDPAKSLVS
ncbi:MAG: hypothetical protein AUH43_10695 [Acidobacteria bacterium 13_1_40CM_65_14]|nr:MAG: hypothetical protein AUH43_10695 [Acidobacteria bacterium 13_1_40CM_65_14]